MKTKKKTRFLDLYQELNMLMYLYMYMCRCVCFVVIDSPSSFKFERRGPFDEDKTQNLLIEFDGLGETVADEGNMVERKQRKRVMRM